MTCIPLDPFIDGLRQTADFLNDAVFSDDIAAMRDALELGRNNLRGAADKLGEVAGNYEKVVRQLKAKVWEAFETITSAYYGKQYYFLQSDGMVYSRYSGENMTFEQAIDEFCGRISDENA